MNMKLPILIEVYLKNENYEVLKLYSPKEAFACVQETEPDLAILDIMMPEMNGFTLCQKIREKYTFPVIMLTAKDEEAVTLTPTEFTILQILLENKGVMISAEDLFHRIWKDEYYSKRNNTITVYVRHLREKLKDSVEHPKYIKTIWGVGYKIEK